MAAAQEHENRRMGRQMGTVSDVSCVCRCCACNCLLT